MVCKTGQREGTEMQAIESRVFGVFEKMIIFLVVATPNTAATLQLFPTRC